jgi:uncharacterized protein
LNHLKLHTTHTWNDYSSFIRKQFGERVQKISVNTGLFCPNLDGTISLDGCTYCTNQSFTPFYCTPNKRITQQLTEGIQFFAPKYHAQKYIAYFQSFTNTYTTDEKFEQMILEALTVDKVIGVSVATRPDSISETQMKFLDKLTEKYFVTVEFGVESSLDRSLQRINRGHDVLTTRKIFQYCKNYRFFTTAHLIIGLPGENKNDILNHVNFINEIQPNFLKLHQLQILRGTAMQNEFNHIPNDFLYFSAEDYMNIVIEFISKLNPNIVIERFTSESPMDLVISPNWNGMKNFEFVNQLRNKIQEKQVYQGKYYKYE